MNIRSRSPDTRPPEYEPNNSAEVVNIRSHSPDTCPPPLKLPKSPRSIARCLCARYLSLSRALSLLNALHARTHAHTHTHTLRRLDQLATAQLAGVLGGRPTEELPHGSLDQGLDELAVAQLAGVFGGGPTAELPHGSRDQGQFSLAQTRMSYGSLDLGAWKHGSSRRSSGWASQYSSTASSGIFYMRGSMRYAPPRTPREGAAEMDGVTAEVGTFDAEEGGYQQEHMPSSSFHTLPLKDMERVMMGLESRQSIATHAPPIADMPYVRVVNPVLTSNGGGSRGLPSENVREYAQPLDPDHGAKPLVPISLRSHNERPITSPIGPGDTRSYHTLRHLRKLLAQARALSGASPDREVFSPLFVCMSLCGHVCVCVCVRARA